MKHSIVSILFLFGTIHQAAGQLTITDGYTDKMSYYAGETVTFFLNGDPGSGKDTEGRIYNTEGELVTTIPLGNMSHQKPLGNTPWKTGFGYNATATWDIPVTKPSGMYMLSELINDKDMCNIPIFVKDGTFPSMADIVVVCPTYTDEAYNEYGGRSLYKPDGVGNTTVCFSMPYTSQNLKEGFLKWLAIWARNKHYTVNFITDLDMEHDVDIQNAKLLIIPGHSEYWSRAARLHFDSFVDSGKDALILSGNTMWWQVTCNQVSNSLLQLTCDRGSAYIGDGGGYSDDPITSSDPLLATYHWNEPSLKYSTLGSIGSDYMHGGAAVDYPYTDTPFCYGGFFGFKITLPQSPVFQGINGNSIPSFALHDILHFPTDEYDGTLVKMDAYGDAILDANNDPQLDVAALGFYRAEMLGYDIITDNLAFIPDPNTHNKPKIHYAPFMIFQKTCTSGTIINVNSNEWCATYGIGLTGTNLNGPLGCENSWFTADGALQPITANMIELMLQDQNSNLKGNNLFSAPPPLLPTFSMQPAYTSVNYNACSGGSINITPCGVYMDQGYKIDNGFVYNQSIPADVNNNLFSATIDNSCSNYNNGRRPILNRSKTDTTKNLVKNLIGGIKFSLSPNPSKNLVNLTCLSPKGQDNYSVTVSDLLGRILYQHNSSESNLQIDLSTYPSGIYIVQIRNEMGEIGQKKVIKL